MTFYVEGLRKVQGAERQVRRIGMYETIEEAMSASRRAIDDFLLREFKAGMTREALLARYQEGGEFPYIFRDDDNTINVPGFNHFQYAMTRCAEICGEKKGG